MALGLESRFERPERLREWTYEFDPAAFELLRRAIERVGAGPGDAVGPGVGAGDEPAPESDAG